MDLTMLLPGLVHAGNQAIVTTDGNQYANEPFELRWGQSSSSPPSYPPILSLYAPSGVSSGPGVTSAATLGGAGATNSVPGSRPTWGLTYATSSITNEFLIYNMSASSSTVAIYTGAWT